MSTLRVDSIANTAGVTNNRVLQVVSLDYTDQFYHTSTTNTYVDITGFSQSITPLSSSSKILVLVNLGRAGTYSNGFRIVRDSTSIGIGSYGSGFLGGFISGYDGTTHGMSASTAILDEPATTSQITYKLQGAYYSASYPLAVNRGGTLGGVEPYKGAYYSSMILMEISA